MKQPDRARPVTTGTSGSAVTSGLGLTLIEVLLALAIASLIALALGHSLQSSRASSAAVDRTLDPVQLLDLAAELLGEDVSQAAHLPWPAPSLIDDLPAGVEALQFVATGLVIQPALHGHSLGVRYIDDSLAAGARARSVTYEAGLDSAGEPQLFRRAGSASRQPIVAGVESLAVTWLVQEGALLAPEAAAAGAITSAVVVRLSARGALRDVVIELPGRPLVELGP